jgi:hypothetical protein
MRHDVRRPVFEGSQMVRALWFDCALHGEAEARRRVLAAWEPGARAYRVHNGFLLEWSRPRRTMCARAPGLPLCERDGVLASAPLSDGERARLQPGSAVLVFGAGMHMYVLAPDLRVDPSLWLDLSSIPLLVPLRMPHSAVTEFVPGVPAPAPDVRAILGDAVPPPSPRRSEFFRRTSQARPASTGRRLRGRAQGLAAAAAILSGTVAGLVILPFRLLGNAGGTSSGARAAPPPGSGWLAAGLARLAMLTRLSSLLGWRQANYLRRMLRQFEQGNLDEALRHAIPLDSPHQTNRPALGTPGRRMHLDVTGNRESATGIGLDGQTMQVLRATYQRSFDILDRAGRIDEAVFVLAELLNRRQEAIDYLERHGRIAQAARLAETLELAPPLIVRLHFMAGDVERAVQLARVADAFGDALAELERRRDERAAALRLEWAHELAARGNVCEAASVVWPLNEERHHARVWLHAAERAGGALSVQGLLYRLALDPEILHVAGDAVHALLHDKGEEAARLRSRACDCILKLDVHNDAVRRIGAALWRQLVADLGTGFDTLPRDRLKALMKFAADPVLAADAPATDLPNRPEPTPLAARHEHVRVTFIERGVLPLEDVRVMPDGGYLLALGESGASLARDDGREIMRFPVPAHHLVLAGNGRRALVLGRREKVVRVGRIDLLNRTASDWFSAGLRFWAGEYDGTTWNVVADERLMALDTAAPGRSVLWQIGDLPGSIIGFDQQHGRQALLLAVAPDVEQWRYVLPERRLLERDRYPVRSETAIILPDCAHPEPVILEVRKAEKDEDTLVLSWSHGTDSGGAEITVLAQGPLHASLHDGFLLLRFEATDGWHCLLVDFNGRLLADVTLPSAVNAQATVHEGHLLAWDRGGRLVDVEIGTSRVRTLTLG